MSLNLVTSEQVVFAPKLSGLCMDYILHLWSVEYFLISAMATELTYICEV